MNGAPPTSCLSALAFGGIQRVIEDGLLVEAVGNSTLVGLGAVLVGVVLGGPAARTLSQLDTPRLAWLAILLPLLLPPLVIGEGLRVRFLRLGLADSLVGLVLAAPSLLALSQARSTGAS